MNKMYQRLKRKMYIACTFCSAEGGIYSSIRNAYAADNGAERAQARSYKAESRTGDFSMSESETSESETSGKEETESCEEEDDNTDKER